MTNKYPYRVKLHDATFGEEEIQAVVAVMRSKNVNSGDKVREFENRFGPYAVLCNSGSSANLLAISALTNPVTENRLRPGDEVIVSALSWSTTVWPLVQHGLIPVIVDIDPRTLNMDMEQARKAIGQNTKAIMPVHVYGNPCDMEALQDFKDRGLTVIEDCCEAFGASWNNRPVGAAGNIATYSFYFSHHMTMMEGGLVVATTKEMGDMLRILRAHGWVRDLDDASRYYDAHSDIDPRFLFVNAGYNLRVTEAQAAMGLVQLEKFPQFLMQRRKAAKMLKDAFAPYEDDLETQHENGNSSWFGFPVVVKPNSRFTSGVLRKHLETNGVETRSIICGNIARQPGLKLWTHKVIGDLRNADHVMKEGFSVGCHQGINESAVAHVSEALRKFFS